MIRPLLLSLAATLTLAACGEDEPSVAERFNSIAAETENRAHTIEAEANASVTEEQRRLDAETDALQREAENAMPAIDPAAAPANTADANAQ